MITTGDQLVNAMGNNSSRIIIDKASISSAVAGQFHSLWRATGQPGQGAIPAAASACNHLTPGGIGFNQQTAPSKSYVGILEGSNSISNSTLELHDRLAAMGGLNGTLTTAQTVGLDLSAISTDNMAGRVGDANYSDVQWWLEWYADTGATVANATVAVTYNDNTTGNLNVVALAATRRASFMQTLNSFIPAGVAGKYIKAVNSVTLSASTGTAGSFGVTATRLRCSLFKAFANVKYKEGALELGMPDVANSACLFCIQLAGSTVTGLERNTGKIIHG